MRHLLLIPILMLAGCDALAPDKTALTATSLAGVSRPDCNACHGNPPRTGGHRYHVDHTQITCWECHSSSMHRMSSKLPLPPLAEGVAGHANGTVEVAFPDSAQWPGADPVTGDSTFWNSRHIPGAKAKWNPADLSCDAVGCHKQPLKTGHYTWRDVEIPSDVKIPE